MPASRMEPARAARDITDARRPFRACGRARPPGVRLMDAPGHLPARRTAAPRVPPEKSDDSQHALLPAAPHFPPATARPHGKAADGGARRSLAPRIVPRLLNRAAIVFAWEIRTF